MSSKIKSDAGHEQQEQQDGYLSDTESFQCGREDKEEDDDANAMRRLPGVAI